MNFHTLTSDAEAFREMSERYNCSSGDYDEWRAKREFVVDAFNDRGSVLDIGCAGGLFLRSLQEWSTYNFDPYGVDISEEYIHAAQQLFPNSTDHFAVLNVQNIGEITNKGLPREYDFIYWNRAAYTQQNSSDDKLFQTIMKMARRRLIVAVYASNNFGIGTPEWQEERTMLHNDIQSFSQAPLVPNGYKVNPSGFNQAICWFDIT